MKPTKFTPWKWLLRFYEYYMAGAKANDFPIKKYGLFGERYHEAK